MGVDQRMGQYMIHDSGVIRSARTIMRMPEPGKLNKDELSKIADTPGTCTCPARWWLSSRTRATEFRR